MRKFISMGAFDIKDRGRAYTVLADRGMDRATPDIIGVEVLLDNKVVKVKAVERFMPGYPIYKGEKIALLI